MPFKKVGYFIIRIKARGRVDSRLKVTGVEEGESNTDYSISAPPQVGMNI
jgi:hypothetical protein